eukprot:s1104_g10.t1
MLLHVAAVLAESGHCQHLMHILPWKAWLVLLVAGAIQGAAESIASAEEISSKADPLEDVADVLPTVATEPSEHALRLESSEVSDGSCSLSSAECESGPQDIQSSAAEITPDLPAAPPLPPPSPPPLPPPLPPRPPAPAPIQAPAFPLPFRSAKREMSIKADSESYGFNDRQAWLSIGQRTESEAEKEMRLAMEDEVKMEAQHFAEVLEHQKQSIHHDAWAYYEGDLMRLKHYKLVGLKSSLIVMCFSPLFARADASASGGGCRAAWLGEQWKADRLEAVEDGSEVSTSKLLPPLPWGQSFPFLEQASVGNHLELARMGDDRFLVCFETTPAMQVSCRMGSVANDTAVISYGALLEDSPARLVSVSPGQGSQFAVCSQSLSSENSRISCRWGQVLAVEGVSAGAPEIQWAAATPLSFAFDDRR